MSNLIALEPDYLTDIASGNSTEHAYSVEARINFREGKLIGKQVFDNRWKRVNFDRAEIGVPAGPEYSQATRHGLLCHAAAQALRWWFHAVADAQHDGYCLETRLVEHKVSCSHQITAIGTTGHYPMLKPPDTPIQKG